MVVVVLASMSSAQASLVINLTQSGVDGVILSISGSGTVTAGGGNPGAILNFDNFTGTPWSSSVDGNFALSPTNVINFGPSTYASVTLDFVAAGTSDLSFRDGTGSINNGNTFNAMGNATVVGLSFANLNVGTYTSNANDSDNFGGVTLNIAATAVPEPSSLALLALFGSAATVSRARRRRKKQNTLRVTSAIV